MSIEAMRFELYHAKGYFGNKWAMEIASYHDKQVIAVYLSFKERGLI